MTHPGPKANLGQLTVLFWRERQWSTKINGHPALPVHARSTFCCANLIPRAKDRTVRVQRSRRVCV